jgi:ketosteroid isomerase-like protein
MSIPDPEQFSRHWAQAWNSRDLEGVLRHFHDDVVFTSPVAAQIVPGSNGMLRGKEALRAYWAEGLKRVPDLHFTVESVYAGVTALVIHYRNQKGILVNEVLIFDGALVREGHGTYPMAAKNRQA